MTLNLMARFRECLRNILINVWNEYCRRENGGKKGKDIDGGIL